MTSPRLEPRTITSAALLALCATLAACQAPGPADDGDDAPLSEIDRLALIHRYNARADAVTRVWTRGNLTAEWFEPDGKRRWEQGNITLILRKPRDLALSVHKVGETFLWLGSNDEKYWAFELAPPDEQPTTLTYGRHAHAAATAARERGLPLRPDQIIDLLGIAPLPANVNGPTRVPDGASFTLAMPPAAGDPAATRTEWTTDAEMLPTHIRITARGAAGEERLIEATLSNHRPLRQTGRPPGAWPLIPTRIEVSVPESRATVTLILEDPSDGRDYDRVSDIQFDLDALTDIHQPQRVIDLDAREP